MNTKFYNNINLILMVIIYQAKLAKPIPLCIRSLSPLPNFFAAHYKPLLIKLN